jgi:Asp-tRNA(Asn)/Glu-tRNA(Gln) amidotransferase A subunit family amidase
MASGDTHGSLFGSTRNPYALELTPGGSSGGTAASIAANFGTVGIGQESYASLRRPAAWCSLAGIRTSPGLISRSGTFGGWPARTGSPGPMTRSVADLAVLLDVLVGYDGEDPLTAFGYSHIPATFTAYLKEGGLDGARIGVIREPMGVESLPESADFAAVDAAFNASVAELTTGGATLVDPLVIPNLAELLATRFSELTPDESQQSWRLYFNRGANAPFATPTELQKSPEYDKVVTRYGVWSQGQSRDVYLRARDELMTTILTSMADQRLDAIVYKSVEHQPQPVSAGVTRAAGYVDGRGSTHLNTFLVDVPAITVPAVPTSDGLPTGITLQGRPYDDGMIIKLAYAYEQATSHRAPPSTTPPLQGEP